MAGSHLTLPQLSSLRITNMTTFPQDLQASFQRGITVIFGGNHSGKTTIVNSIKYGIFGLSWNQTPESPEKRYFSSRIKEIGKKSLEITASYRIKSYTTTVRRTVFSSGTTEIESKMTKGSGNELATSAEILKHERGYYESLQELMGLSDKEQLKFIPNMIFADETRQPVLWTKNLEDFILSLLTSRESADRLALVEAQLNKAKKDLEQLHQKQDQLKQKNEDIGKVLKFLKNSLEMIDQTGIAKHIEEYETKSKELDDCRTAILRLNEELQKELVERSNLQEKLNANQSSLLGLEPRLEEIHQDRIKAFLNPDNPKETQMARYFYYEKKCPFCLADLSREVDFRIENQKCAICGKGALGNYKIDMKDIDRQFSELRESKEKLTRQGETLQKAIDEANLKINTLSRSIQEYRVKEATLVRILDETKTVQQNLHERDAMLRKSEELQKQMESNNASISKIEKEVRTVETEIEKINQLQSKIKESMKMEIDSAFAKIKKRFSSFIKIATNGELTGELSQNFIPSLNGRAIFHPDAVSQFERTLMDFAFRIALLSVFAEMSETIPSLILETPDEVTDESYIPHLAKGILSFSDNLSIVVTTVNSTMMKQLLKDFEPIDRKKHLIDLISKGTPTQRKFYTRSMADYLGG